MNAPVLYSFRRCPYAIRARMALVAAHKQVELREILLRDKPASMLAASAKGTVPVLVDSGNVIDESLGVIQWALNDLANDQWRVASLSNPLVAANDEDFKYWLDRYKYFERFPEYPQQYYLDRARTFLDSLEANLLEHGKFLEGNKPFAVDLAIFPFIRQFAHVDLAAFRSLPYARLQTWLDFWLASDLFKSVMKKYDVWQDGESGIKFGLHNTHLV